MDGYRAIGPIATPTSGSAFITRDDRVEGRGANRGESFLRLDGDECVDIAEFGQCARVGHSL
jgi:hypothetical protein